MRKENTLYIHDINSLSVIYNEKRLNFILVNSKEIIIIRRKRKTKYFIKLETSTHIKLG